MKDFVKITKATWKFYLTVLIVSLLFVVCNSLLLCNGRTFQYVDDVSSFHSEGVVFTDFIIDKMQNYDLLGFHFIIAAIAGILFIRHFVFMDQRTKEFQYFLPVKQRTLVLHDFLFMTGIIVISFLMMAGIFLAGQTKYNKDMLKAASIHQIEGMDSSMVSNANGEMIKYILYYFIFVFFVFSIIFLGMLLCRNCFAGGIIAIVIWRMCICFLDNIYFDGWYEYDVYRIGIFHRETEVSNALIKMSERICIAIDPYGFSWEILSNKDNGNILFITVGCIVAVVLLIVIAAGKIELSKGKLFYFSCVDCLFSIACGVSVTFYLNREFRADIFLSVIIGAAVWIFIWWLIHPRANRKRNKWEVK